MDIFSAPPPPGAPTMSLLSPQQASYQGPAVPAALKDSLFILDSSRGSHMLPQLNQVGVQSVGC